ncbi:MAG: hypothetical protein P9L89_08185 [Candidatus Celaenobacter polaris]|nr:hypothetical protein [Candidatus Celaenobacter polaris]
MGQTLRLVFISLRPIRQLADQGDNSKDRYKLTVFLKVIFREEFSENTLFMHYRIKKKKHSIGQTSISISLVLAKQVEVISESTSFESRIQIKSPLSRGVSASGHPFLEGKNYRNN